MLIQIYFLLQGGRAIEDFIKYVSENASDKLKGYDRKGNVISKDEL